MTRSIWKGCGIILLVGWLTILSAHRLFEQRTSQRESLARLSLVSPSFINVVALEFKGASADFLLLKTMTFLGENVLGNINPTRQEWEYVYSMLKLVTSLDERFWDPYLLAESMLVMQGGMIEEGNELLEKVAKIRTDDFRPYFLLWFNAYYFQKDNDRAENFMHLAALKPNAPGYLAGLAARMSLYGGRTESGMFFLEALLRDTPPTGTMYGYLEKRLIALKNISYLEFAVKKFKKELGEMPKLLEDLIEYNIIPKIPTDPYGGEFHLTPNGRVYTTSKLVQQKQEN